MCFGALSGVSSSWQTLGCLNISQGMVLQFVFPCVTASYRAPELWHAAQRDLSKWLGPAVDLWSFGCVLYEVAVGKILMRPLRNNLCGCENTIKEWCQQWQSLQKSLQGSIRPSLSNAQVSRNFDYRLVNRLHLLEPSFRPAIKAMLNPDPAQRDWAGID